ncbi:hypothetical protein AURDEDRAFT_71918, partial [Auricularia subglabra TFB-10046 SS5]
IYPRLSRMACDYLMIPATSIGVERVFSRGRHLLPYTCNRLSGQSTRALLCLGEWSRAGLVKDEDIMKVVVLPEVTGDEEAFDDGWDSIAEVIVLED